MALTISAAAAQAALLQQYVALGLLPASGGPAMNPLPHVDDVPTTEAALLHHLYACGVPPPSGPQ